MKPTLHCMLYHSQLAPDASFGCITDIIKTARSFNAVHGVTGILVFDGHRFIQQLEGPSQVLTDLIVRIARDPRHVNFTLLHQCAFTGDRRFRNWSMAYAHIENGEPLANLALLRGQAAIEHFTELMPSLDIA